MGLSQCEEEEQEVSYLELVKPAVAVNPGNYIVGQEEEDGGGMSFAWLLVPLVGAVLFAGFLKLASTKV
ncbi:hypothetical protein KKC06_06725 [Patescibacteria group bacterium]|nr:hypothetical protein [Patescibacteria group bacterium]